jgi:hypothetical protein
MAGVHGTQWLDLENNKVESSKQPFVYINRAARTSLIPKHFILSFRRYQHLPSNVFYFTEICITPLHRGTDSQLLSSPAAFQRLASFLAWLPRRILLTNCSTRFGGIRRWFVEGKGKNTDDDDDHNSNNRNRNNITSLDRYKGISESRRKAEKEEGVPGGSEVQAAARGARTVGWCLCKSSVANSRARTTHLPQNDIQEGLLQLSPASHLGVCKDDVRGRTPKPTLGATYESIGLGVLTNRWYEQQYNKIGNAKLDWQLQSTERSMQHILRKTAWIETRPLDSCLASVSNDLAWFDYRLWIKSNQVKIYWIKS